MRTRPAPTGAIICDAGEILALNSCHAATNHADCVTMLILDDRKFIQAPFANEEELELVVVANAEYIFGPSSIYFPKALIRTGDGAGTIPDGFAIDLTGREWYIVEAELARHSVWSHIAPQVAKQIIAAQQPVCRELLANLAVEKARDDESVRERFLDEGIDLLDVRRFLDLILRKPPIIGIPIDAVSQDLREWAATLKNRVNLWIVRKHVEFGNPDVVMYELPEQFRPVSLESADPAASTAAEVARYDVEISDLVAAGLLHAGQTLRMPYKPRNGDKRVFEGRVLDNGSIEILDKPFTSPSYAALYGIQAAGSDRKTVNGWIAWRTQENKSLADLREDFLTSRNKDRETVSEDTGK